MLRQTQTLTALTVALLLATGCDEADGGAEPTPDAAVSLDQGVNDADAPEADADAPEADANAPEADADTPEPDADLPEPDADLPEPDAEPMVIDADGDGSPAGEDCDDTDPRRYPGAVEACDGVDNNCDGDASDVGTASFIGADGLVGITDQVTGTPDDPARYRVFEGGEVVFCPGTFHVSLGVTAVDLTVRSSTGEPSDVTLTGSLDDDAFTTALVVRDLTLAHAADNAAVFSGANTTLQNVRVLGSGLWGNEFATITLDDVVFEGDGTPGRAALRGEWASVTGADVQMRGYAGGGLSAQLEGDLRLVNSVVEDHADSGLKPQFVGDAGAFTVDLTGTVLRRNTCVFRGGGLFYRRPAGAAVHVIGGTFDANVCRVGAAINGDHDLTVTGATITGHAEGSPVQAGVPMTLVGLVCTDNPGGCVHTYDGGAGAVTLTSGRYLRNGDRTLIVSRPYDLRITDADFGEGDDANALDIWRTGDVHDLEGVTTYACVGGEVCPE